MEFKFDKIDKKLISRLYHNYREPLTEIAKACRISRDQAEYRLKKLESSGILKKFATIFNYSALGFEEFVIVWLRLNCTKEQKLQLREELRKNKNILTYFDIVGNYNLGFDCIYKNKHEFQREFGEFLSKHKNIIKSHSTFITTSFNFFPLKEFDITQTEKEFSLEEKNEKIKLGEKDIRILKELEKNGRAKIIDIAKSLNISAELALYRLKNLYKNKIVLGSRIIFDMEKMNYFFGNLRLNLRHINEKIKQEILNYCKQHKFINVLSFGIGEYNCLVQFFFSQEIQFRNSIKEFLEKFNNEINYSDIILIENEGEIKTLPL